jgi:hypothetical protein
MLDYLQGLGSSFSKRNRRLIVRLDTVERQILIKLITEQISVCFKQQYHSFNSSLDCN